MPRAWERYGQQPVPPDSLVNTPIQAHTQMGWQGGWQPDKPLIHLGPDELSVCTNFKWNEGYGLERRLGCDRVTTTVAGMDQAHHGHIQNVWTSSIFLGRSPI